MNKNVKDFLESFKNTKLWKNMESMKEDSPWHREDSVAIHTQMILDHYFEVLAPYRTEREQALTFLAIVFHDTGKPVVMEVREDEAKGGPYKSFRNHEAKSARIWEDYACQNWFKWQKLKTTFDLQDKDLTLVQWCIENHLWYKLKDRKKLARVLSSPLFGNGALANVFLDLCESDTNGRISDTREQELYQLSEFKKQMYQYLDEVALMNAPEKLEDQKPIMEILIGASGSGKSSYCNELISTKGFSYHSLDDLRLSFAKSAGVVGKFAADTYSKAFDYCGIHRGPFRQYVEKHISFILNEKLNVVIDNTNTSEKARSDYIQKAKRAGYEVRCVMFPIELAKLTKRQKSRTDKLVPQVAVLDQYNKVSVPWVSVECDKLDTIMTNIDGNE